MARTFNIFEIGRRRADEDQLTNMLIWLADAVPAVRAHLVEMALGRPFDPSEIEVATQYWIEEGRLDALLCGPNFRVVVEAKLGTEYAAGQIQKYLDWLHLHRPAVEFSGLMTLTARRAPWPPDDAFFAETHGIAAEPRLWADLHDELDPLRGSDNQLLDARLIGQFLEMLHAENLVPMRPLTADELGSRWADSWRVVNRYGAFLEGCKEEIAERLRGTALPHRSSKLGGWIHQDYSLDDGSRAVVGLGNTDENEQVPTTRRTPILWVGVAADQLPVWPEIAHALARDRPAGWYRGNDWDGRPTMWRYLAEVTGEGEFAEQRTRLATRVADARDWLARATSSRVMSSDGPQ